MADDGKSNKLIRYNSAADRPISSFGLNYKFDIADVCSQFLVCTFTAFISNLDQSLKTISVHCWTLFC